VNNYIHDDLGGHSLLFGEDDEEENYFDQK
jgi:hypothetical protein